VSIISLARTAAFLPPVLLPPAAADCTRPLPMLPLVPCVATLASAAVDERGLKPLTVTLRGKPMVRMRVCSFSRDVVDASSTLVCLQCSTWEVLLALHVGGKQKQQGMCHAVLF
jgi:hypothetical protein